MTTTEYILSKPSLTNLTFKDLKAYYEDSIKPICEANNNPFPLWIYNQDDKANVTVKDLEILVKSIFGDAIVELPVKLFSQPDSLIVNIGLLSVVHNEYVIPSGVVPTPDIQFTCNENFTGFGLNAPNGNSIAVDWGDSTTDNFTGSGNLDLLEHTYTDPGSYTVKVTVTGATEFKVNFDSGVGSDSLLTVDVMPSSITNFNVAYNSLLTSIDTTGLISCLLFNCNYNTSLSTINTTALSNCTGFYCNNCYSLTTIDTTNLTNCIYFSCGECTNLTIIDTTGLISCIDFNSSLCTSLTTLDTIALTSCINFNCNYCVLDTTNINNALINLDTFGLNNGAADLSNQTPAAPPSGAGITAMNNLIGKNWTVTVDV
jgi:PKD repeat protein